PLQFCTQDVKVLVFLQRADELHRPGSLLNVHGVAVVQFYTNLPIQGDPDVLVARLQYDLNVRRIWEDQRAVTQGIGANGSENECLQVRMHNRTASRHGIGRGPSGGGDNQTVGTVCRQVQVIDRGFEVDDARQGALVNNYIIEHHRLRQACTVLAVDTGF